jgi:hypothetical protein
VGNNLRGPAENRAYTARTTQASRAASAPGVLFGSLPPIPRERETPDQTEIIVTLNRPEFMIQVADYYEARSQVQMRERRVIDNPL